MPQARLTLFSKVGTLFMVLYFLSAIYSLSYLNGWFGVFCNGAECSRGLIFALPWGLFLPGLFNLPTSFVIPAMFFLNTITYYALGWCIEALYRRVVR